MNGMEFPIEIAFPHLWMHGGGGRTDQRRPTLDFAPRKEGGRTFLPGGTIKPKMSPNPASKRDEEGRVEHISPPLPSSFLAQLSIIYEHTVSSKHTITCGQIRINSTCNSRTTKFAPSVVIGSYMNHDEGRPQLQTVPAFFGPWRVKNVPVFY